ncbi:hypothetical protein Bca101_032818 [Brassica carinata]
MNLYIDYNCPRSGRGKYLKFRFREDVYYQFPPELIKYGDFFMASVGVDCNVGHHSYYSSSRPRSLDCGLPGNELSPYIETNTKLNFSSDGTFIESGKTAKIQEDRLQKPYKTIRYFPDGIQNCYNLNVQMGRKYLIRASFIYGNYDGSDSTFVFDLYLGPNLWATIDSGTWVDGSIREDILHIPTSNLLQICLVKTGDTTPLISALELRPMGNDSYITKSGSLKLHERYYLSKYSSDIYDRIWESYFKTEWSQISTDLDVVNSNKYDPPKDVLKNAATPTNASEPLTMEWIPVKPDDQYCYYAHFAEIQDLQANETREFNVLWNGLIRTNRSTLPPLLNALEVYTVVQFPTSETDESDGFISLDCGLPVTEPSPYNELSTGLQFSSDAKFIQSGKIGKIQANLESQYLKPYTRRRYFPEGIRNCYNLPVENNRKYLIWSRFVYGNYDDLNTYPQFDLHLGPNPWATIDLQEFVNGTVNEIIHTQTSNSLQICLVKTGKTTPMISALELRPLGNNSYNTESGSLNLFIRMYANKTDGLLRYPDDVYDRSWFNFLSTSWSQIFTTLEVSNDNNYAPPKKALATAAIPSNLSAPLTVSWTPEKHGDQYYLYSHFAEIQDLHANDTREFDVLWNGAVTVEAFVPSKLLIDTFMNKSPETCDGGKCSYQLIKTSKSTLPPLLNALEIYTVIQFPRSETDENDVVAIKDIETAYGLSRIKWQGDPCVPQMYAWDGLNCSYTAISTPPRITSLNLRGNDLTGHVPQALQRNGLELLVEGNPRLCLSGSCTKDSKKKFPLIIVASVASVAIIVIVLVLVFVLKKKKQSSVEAAQLPPITPNIKSSIETKKRRFTYSEVMKMTNNFQTVVGEGGFGVVCHGTLNDSEQVAVKLLSQSSSQGYKHFKAEVVLLLRVHYTNLVNLVGYCDEGDHLALIYEFMPNGDLKQHLSGSKVINHSGKRGESIFKWGSRLQIALEAALGLEYLHVGCTPPIVHRDIKTTNILLDQQLKAKIADFGLSRSFLLEVKPKFQLLLLVHLDILIQSKYYHTSRLGEKSDVYSFGIVLLEMITNQPVIDQSRERSHIAQWVGFELNRGDITRIIDPNLHRDYESRSVWRVLELAMSCVNPSSLNRPNMSEVANELKECLASEKSRRNMNMDSQSSPEVSISFDTGMFPRAR